MTSRHARLTTLTAASVALLALAACTDTDRRAGWEFRDTGTDTENRLTCRHARQMHTGASGQFEQTSDGGWSRRLSSFDAGCARYFPRISIEDGAGDFSVEGFVCNTCDSKRMVSPASFSPVDTTPRPRWEHARFGLVALVDGSGTTFAQGCYERVGRADVVTAFELSAGTAKRFSATYPAEWLWDHRDLPGRQRRDGSYWQDPIDYTEPLELTIWWAKPILPEDAGGDAGPHSLHLPCTSAGFAPVVPSGSQERLQKLFARQKVGAANLPTEMRSFLVDEQMATRAP